MHVTATSVAAAGQMAPQEQPFDEGQLEQRDPSSSKSNGSADCLSYIPLWNFAWNFFSLHAIYIYTHIRDLKKFLF